MNDKYSIESLVKTYQRHHEEYEKNRKQWFQDNGMGEPPPIDFDVNLALKSICEQILHLRRSLFDD